MATRATLQAQREAVARHKADVLEAGGKRMEVLLTGEDVESLRIVMERAWLSQPGAVKAAIKALAKGS